MIYLLRDDLFGEERLAELRTRVGPPDIQSLNVTVLDGQRLSVAELRSAADALPFLGERRLVVVRRLFGTAAQVESSPDSSASRKSGRADADREQAFLRYFSSLPPTTDLVLVEDRDFRADHPVAKAIAAMGGEVGISSAPRWDQLARWIEQRVQQKGGRITRAAAQELSSLPIEDLRQLDLILESLVTYAGGQPIGPLDVRTLVHLSREVDVFDLVDAVGARDRRGALEAYRRLLAENVSPIYLLVMLTRQVRLLLLTHEALGRHEDVAGSLKVHPRVAQKLVQQARAFGVERCLAAYQRLAAVDEAIKMGEADEELAVELLLLELTES
jgi:DNA polymerase-3 subunit delta